MFRARKPICDKYHIIKTKFEQLLINIPQSFNH